MKHMAVLLLVALAGGEALAKGRGVQEGDGACVAYKIQFCGARSEPLSCLKSHLKEVSPQCAAAVQRKG